MRKDGSIRKELNGCKGLEGGYINHALSETDLDHSFSYNHREINGSSDFVCKFLFNLFII